MMLLNLLLYPIYCLFFWRDMVYRHMSLMYKSFNINTFPSSHIIMRCLTLRLIVSFHLTHYKTLVKRKIFVSECLKTILRYDLLI